MYKDKELDAMREFGSVTLKHEAQVSAIETVSPQDGEVVSEISTPDAPGTVMPQISKRFTGILRRLSSRQAQRHTVDVEVIQEQCRRLCLSVFFREHAPSRSLGFTSSVGGEGKTLLAMVTASVLVNDSQKPVTLLECNWEHPCLHEHFGFAPKPGLAEWLRGECDKASILHQVRPNLTAIPAGNGQRDAIRLLHHIRKQGLSELLALSHEPLIVELPAIASTAYSLIAASLLDALVVVVHSGVTSDAFVAEACAQIKNLPVEGVILNQIESRIPHWLQQML